LIAADLQLDVKAYGVDLDQEAIEAGQRTVPANIQLQVASGDCLPFMDCMFDFVFSRVALPLMRIDPTLHEIRRVLKPGGDLWLMLHPLSFDIKLLQDAARDLQFKQVVGRGYVLVNGLLFNSLGWQLSLFGHCETFQTPKGIRRALERAGFKAIVIGEGRHLTVSARKPRCEV
jgi:ubiquinone/menaquinone biosynthesis C-methylase UbiE